MAKMLRTLGKWIVPVIVAAAAVVVVITRTQSGPVYFPTLTLAKIPNIEVTENLNVLPGTIRGNIVWNGPVPDVKPIFGYFHSDTGWWGRRNWLHDQPDGPRWRYTPNPLAPIMLPDRRVGEAIVWLKDFKGPKQKPWPYPPVRVDARDSKIDIYQGPKIGSLALIKAGDKVDLQSTNPSYEMIRVREAEFFSLPFAKPGSTKRKFTQPGHVRFTSGMGNHLDIADAWVCEHSYFAISDERGVFELANVPLGEYEVSVWLRNWDILSHDRDPETGKYIRFHYDKPIVASMKVLVQDATPVIVSIPLSK